MRAKTMPADAPVRAQLEAYYDAVPRASARVEDFGSLSLFVRTNPGWPYYGRPAAGVPGPITLSAVRALLERQRQLGLPQSIEWVHETTPGLDELALAAGLVVHRHPLMIFDADAADPPIRANARVLGPDDPALPAAIAAAQLAFAEPGPAPGSAGHDALADKAAELSTAGWLVALAERIRAGRTVVAAAFDDDGQQWPVSSGQHNPVDQTSELVGIGTLPAIRRRGFGSAVTSALVRDARDRGIDTIFLSAGDEDVARLYARIGFRRVGTALIAEPPPS